ncbi:MAG: UxaA family hydrolase [Prevotella sp.]|nr:UxaA family hydrolase [Prevotella sp.]MBR1462987.1 UxaA family hydrolase [Prevotella sp.]
MKNYILLKETDNVAVLLKDLHKGDVIEVNGRQIALLCDIRFEHKVAIRDIAEGENVLKYGLPIGHATQPIRCGEHVHEHNLASNYTIQQ